MRKSILSIVLALALFLSIGIIVLAVADPDSDPTVSNIRSNRYLIESGDVLIYADYNIPYASLPTDAASNTYIFRLLDGSTEKGIITPFVLMDNGYNEGVIAFYFSASDNLTWGEAYTIRISQNPTYFDEPQSWDYVMPLSAYTTSSTQEANQLELAINIIAAAQRLETHHTDYAFVEDSAGGTILSSPTGETYFRGAILGIQSMAPDLFLVQVLSISTESREWDTTQFDTYANRFSGTWVETDIEATGTQFNLETQWVMGMLVILPLCIGFIIVSSIKYQKAEPGFVAASVLLILGALMSWIPTGIFASIYQGLGIYLAYVWFYSRG